MRAAIFAAMLAFCSPALGQSTSVPTFTFIGENITPDVIGPVRVRLNDSSSDACWTNLRDVREYTEERLIAGGFELAEANGPEVFQIIVAVSAFRERATFGQGRCLALISVDLGRGLRTPEGATGNHIVASTSVAVRTNDNLNEGILWFVGEFFNGLRDSQQASE